MIQSKLLEVIRGTAQQMESGTVTVVFEDYSSGRFYYDAGKVLLAKYKGFEGVKALESCQELGVRTARFHADIDIVGSSVSLDSQAT